MDVRQFAVFALLSLYGCGGGESTDVNFSENAEILGSNYYEKIVDNPDPTCLDSWVELISIAKHDHLENIPKNLDEKCFLHHSSGKGLIKDELIKNTATLNYDKLMHKYNYPKWSNHKLWETKVGKEIATIVINGLENSNKNIGIKDQPFSDAIEMMFSGEFFDHLSSGFEINDDSSDRVKGRGQLGKSRNYRINADINVNNVIRLTEDILKPKNKENHDKNILFIRAMAMAGLINLTWDPIDNKFHNSHGLLRKKLIHHLIKTIHNVNSIDEADASIVITTALGSFIPNSKDIIKKLEDGYKYDKWDDGIREEREKPLPSCSSYEELFFSIAQAIVFKNWYESAIEQLQPNDDFSNPLKDGLWNEIISHSKSTTKTFLDNQDFLNLEEANFVSGVNKSPVVFNANRLLMEESGFDFKLDKEAAKGLLPIAQKDMPNEKNASPFFETSTGKRKPYYSSGSNTAIFNSVDFSLNFSRPFTSRWNAVEYSFTAFVRPFIRLDLETRDVSFILRSMSCNFYKRRFTISPLDQPFLDAIEVGAQYVGEYRRQHPNDPEPENEAYGDAHGNENFAKRFFFSGTYSTRDLIFPLFNLNTGENLSYSSSWNRLAAEVKYVHSTNALIALESDLFRSRERGGEAVWENLEGDAIFVDRARNRLSRVARIAKHSNIEAGVLYSMKTEFVSGDSLASYCHDQKAAAASHTFIFNDVLGGNFLTGFNKYHCTDASTPAILIKDREVIQPLLADTIVWNVLFSGAHRAAAANNIADSANSSFRRIGRTVTGSLSSWLYQYVPGMQPFGMRSHASNGVYVQLKTDLFKLNAIEGDDLPYVFDSYDFFGNFDNDWDPTKTAPIFIMINMFENFSMPGNLSKAFPTKAHYKLETTSN